jgi:putative transcriptional regulator
LNFMPTPNGQSGALDALLASYAAGALSRPLHILVASHLVLKSDNRAFVATLEDVIASDIADGSATLSSRERDSRLAAIFSIAIPEAEDLPEAGAAFLPAPLSQYIGQAYETLPWRSVMPGLKEVQFDHAPGCEASMLWIKRGCAMPAHTHPGIEATLVLKGSFEDASGFYGRGDLAVVDSDVDHKPVAGRDEDCICFAVSDGPVKLTGPIARLFQKLIRH